MKTNKKRIRLTESNLKNIIKESVKRILKESTDTDILDVINEYSPDVPYHVNEASFATKCLLNGFKKYRDNNNTQFMQVYEEIYEMLDIIYNKIRKISEPLNEYCMMIDSESDD